MYVVRSPAYAPHVKHLKIQLPHLLLKLSSGCLLHLASLSNIVIGDGKVLVADDLFLYSQGNFKTLEKSPGSLIF